MALFLENTHTQRYTLIHTRDIHVQIHTRIYTRHTLHTHRFTTNIHSTDTHIDIVLNELEVLNRFLSFLVAIYDIASAQFRF